MFPLKEKTIGDNVKEKIRSEAYKGGLMSNSGLSQAVPKGGMEPPTDETHLVSTCRRVPINWVSGRTLRTSTEPVVATLNVPLNSYWKAKLAGWGLCTPF